VAGDLSIQSPLGASGMLDPIPINTRNLAPSAANDRAAVKAAKDFESVLLHRVLEEMRKTVPDSELLDSPASDQMMGMFYMYLAQDTAQKGGFGLWKQIYQQMKPQGPQPAKGPDAAKGSDPLAAGSGASLR